MLGGPLMNANQKRIVGFALKSRLPSMYDSREAVDAGGLMYYGADLADSYRRVAYYVDRILKGAKPADLAGGAADEVRAGDQSEDGEADRPDDSAGGAGAGGQADQVKMIECSVVSKNIRRQIHDEAHSVSGCCQLLILIFAFAAAHAQQTGKVSRIGFLDTSTASGSAVLVEAFRQELSKLGWIEGKNFTIEYRFAEHKGLSA